MYIMKTQNITLFFYRKAMWFWIIVFFMCLNLLKSQLYIKILALTTSAL